MTEVFTYTGEGSIFPHDAVRVRIHPSVNRIPDRAFFLYRRKKIMFSLEIPEGISQIEDFAFSALHSLRNVAFPTDCSISVNVLHICPQLRQVLGVKDEDGVGSEGWPVINALKHRFDDLPLHKLLYYQSYTNITAEQLDNATDIRISRRRSKLNPSGNQQDCLGMTPLHIMTCSTVQQLDLYRVLIDKYPDNLITEDAWGSLPLFYAIWGRVPDEIVQFLVQKYQSLYPNHEFDWSMMIETLGRKDAPKETSQNLLDVRQESFPNQIIDWHTVLEKASSIPTPANNYCQTSLESFRQLLEFSIKERVGAIGPQWRDNIMRLIQAFDDQSNPQFKLAYEASMRRSIFLTELESRLSHSESEYQNLKEACMILELALWKKEMNNNSQGEQGNKRTKLDVLNIQKECRIVCGADIVIEHVLPYLLPGTVRQPPDANGLCSGSDFMY